MDGTTRREKMIELLHQESEPISGNALAKMFGVSRQVIVQDIALLRATNRNIVSTNKGYIIYGQTEKKMARRIVAVRHEDSQIADELNTIVDAGGSVLDVIVEHEVYGQISVDLYVNSRRDVKEFVKKCKVCKTKPLMILTDDIHYHTIQAEDEKTLDVIAQDLKRKGYLISL